MVSVQVKSRVAPDGILELRIPTNLPEGEVEVVLVIQPLSASETGGWPPGFFERTAGAWKGELDRPPQGEFENRETFYEVSA